MYKNKDFEIIDKATDKIDVLIVEHEIDMPEENFIKSIYEAAERMAKRIEELEEETKSRSQSEEMLVLMYNELKRDLAAAKPITCVECKYEPTCNCEVMTYAGKEILQNQRHEIAYCSRAERKEGE